MRLRASATGNAYKGGGQLREAIESTLDVFERTLAPRSMAIALGRTLRTANYVAQGGSELNTLTQSAANDPTKLLSALGRKRRHSWIDDKGSKALVVPIEGHSKFCGFVILSAPSKNEPEAIKVAQTLTAQLGLTVQLVLDSDRERHRAAHDPLTGAETTRFLYPNVERAIQSAIRRDEDIALMFIDVDRLKRVNTNHGHAAGSEVLKRTANALLKTIPYPGKLYRFGGDEFVATIPHIERDDALDLADQLRAAVAELDPDAMSAGSKLRRTTVSIGVATLRYSVDLKTKSFRNVGARLLSAADRALYRAKDGGRNRTVLAKPGDENG
ncbi:MAG: GGDEF domain-containing protein [Polyangiales bacterium]